MSIKEQTVKTPLSVPYVGVGIILLGHGFSAVPWAPAEGKSDRAHATERELIFMEAKVNESPPESQRRDIEIPGWNMWHPNYYLLPINIVRRVH